MSGFLGLHGPAVPARAWYNSTCVAIDQRGGVLASTEVWVRGTRAERLRLVNPVETNVTADTQLALAA